MLKKIFIPGWFDTAENRVDYEGLDIWIKKINPSQKIEAEYVIGHSLGACFAILNWEKNKNTKLILVNPTMFHKGFLGYFSQWIRFLFREGTRVNKKRLKCFLHLYLGIKQGLELINKDYDKIIEQVPQNDILVIRGKNDKYLFSEKAASVLKAKGVKIIEVAEAGHSWNEKFSKEIDKLIS